MQTVPYFGREALQQWFEDLILEEGRRPSPVQAYLTLTRAQKRELFKHYSLFRPLSWYKLPAAPLGAKIFPPTTVVRTFLKIVNLSEKELLFLSDKIVNYKIQNSALSLFLSHPSMTEKVRLRTFYQWAFLQGDRNYGRVPSYENGDALLKVANRVAEMLTAFNYEYVTFRDLVLEVSALGDIPSEVFKTLTKDKYYCLNEGELKQLVNVAKEFK